MRKQDFCLCENKGADQCLCFRYMDSTIPLLLKYEFSSIYPSSEDADRFVSDLVGNPEDRFSRVAAHLLVWPSLPDPCHDFTPLSP